MNEKPASWNNISTNRIPDVWNINNMNLSPQTWTSQTESPNIWNIDRQLPEYWGNSDAMRLFPKNKGAVSAANITDKVLNAMGMFAGATKKFGNAAKRAAGTAIGIAKNAADIAKSEETAEKMTSAKDKAQALASGAGEVLSGFKGKASSFVSKHKKSISKKNSDDTDGFEDTEIHYIRILDEEYTEPDNEEEHPSVSEDIDSINRDNYIKTVNTDSFENEYVEAEFPVNNYADNENDESQSKGSSDIIVIVIVIIVLIIILAGFFFTRNNNKHVDSEKNNFVAQNITTENITEENTTDIDTENITDEVTEVFEESTVPITEPRTEAFIKKPVENIEVSSNAYGIFLGEKYNKLQQYDEYSISDITDNQFAIYDIDNDGHEELLLSLTSGSMECSLILIN